MAAPAPAGVRSEGRHRFIAGLVGFTVCAFDPRTFANALLASSA